jgi:hypothetical protein
MNQGALRRVAVALVAIAACLGIAACGSSSSNSSGSGSGSSTTASGTGTTSTTAASFQARRAALTACLKSHGVTLPNNGRFGPGGGRPPGTGTNPAGVPGRGLFGGGGPGGAGRPGGFLSNPKMRAAFQACAPNFGRGFGGGRFRRAQLSHTAINNFVACVRKNGFNMPAPNFSGKGGVFPANIRTNPKFVSAAKACASMLVPPQPAGGTTTGTSTT